MSSHDNVFVCPKAMEMVDRYLSQQNTPTQDFLNDPKQYQLLTMVALYIAIKVNESIAFGSDLLAEISCGAYTVEEIEATELSILHGLGFRLYAPSSFQMAQHILSLIAPHVILRESTWSFILDEVKFGLEYSVRDYFFSTRRPSKVALAAIFNAVDQVDPELFQEFAIVASLVMGSTLATPSELVASKSRLKHLIESEAPKEEDHGVYETPVCEKHSLVKNTQEDPTTKLGEFSASSSIKSVRNAKNRGAMAMAA